ncbi:MAG: allantoinase [Chloroflexia bacterium]
MHDLIIRNGTLVTPHGIDMVDVAVEGGRIVELGSQVESGAREEIDAAGLHVFPGVIDAHLHFNEPGRADWEGFQTGSRAAAAGGTTTYFDMPLNSHPPTTTAEGFDLKLAAAQASSLVDFGLWGGIVPGNLAHLEELAALGVVGYKAFMSNSGIEDFPAVDDLTLYEGVREAARLGLIVALHAENNTITGYLAQRYISQKLTSVRNYLRSRPVVAELEAINRAIFFAQETGCKIHIVHVSSGRGVTLVAEARARGVDVSCETCPHYLAFTEEDVERLGAVAKCAPPIRSAAEREALWAHLLAGTLPMVASDHSPAPASMKTGDDFFKIWGGISGCQSLLAVLLTDGHFARKLPLDAVAQVTSAYVARRFDIAGKGRIEPGADADLTIVDLRERWTLQPGALLYRHRHSPYVGKSMQGRVIRTIVRGTTVYKEGKIVSGPLGRQVRPAVDGRR